MATNNNHKKKSVANKTLNPNQKRKPQNGFNKGSNQQPKKKFIPRTFERKVPHNEFGKNLYEYVSRLFTVKDGQAYEMPNPISVKLFDALKEVKLIDKAIKRIKFKSLPKNEIVPNLKSLNDLHNRKKTILSLIAEANVNNKISVKIGGNLVEMTMFTARMQLKEMAQYAKRFKDSGISIGNDNTESIIKEIESVIIDIEAELDRKSKEIYIKIPR